MSEHWSGLPGFEYFGDVLRGHQLTRGGVHEASHAILDVMAGFSPGETRVWMVGEHVAGVTICEREKISPEQMPGWLIACVGGQVGEAMWHVLYKGDGFDKAMGDAEAGASGDMKMFRDYGGRQPPISLAMARSRAQQMLTLKWSLIETHAARLVRDGSAPASAVKT